MKMKTKYQYLKEINEIWNNEWKLTTGLEYSEYTGSRAPFSLYHKKCDKVITKKEASKFKQNYCPNCFNRDNSASYNKKTKEEKEAIVKKREATMLERYGAANAMKVDSLKQKQKETLIENYGVDNPMKSKEIKEKALNTTFDNYGAYSSKKQSPQNFIKFIESFTEELGHKPNTKEIAERLGYSGITVPNRLINEFQCRNLIDSLKHRSMDEQEILDFILSVYSGKIETNNRSILDGKEIDIYLPELKLGIEYCGLYWHGSASWASNGNPRSKTYHKDKMELAQIKGIHLIQIFEDEWLYKKEIVKSKIARYLKVFNGNRVYARNCKVKVIDTLTARNFIENNHIQGYSNATIKLGLFYLDKIIGCMTFAKNFKGGKEEGAYELSRFCTDINLGIIGAAGKLLKYFIENYNPVIIRTYSDNRWSNPKSNIYQILGFKETGITPPNYFYIPYGTYKRLHRLQFQKNKLKNKFPEIYSETKTEKQIMEELGYNIIYDAGNIKYEMKIQA